MIQRILKIFTAVAQPCQHLRLPCSPLRCLNISWKPLLHTFKNGDSLFRIQSTGKVAVCDFSHDPVQGTCSGLTESDPLPNTQGHGFGETLTHQPHHLRKIEGYTSRKDGGSKQERNQSRRYETEQQEPCPR